MIGTSFLAHTYFKLILAYQTMSLAVHRSNSAKSKSSPSWPSGPSTSSSPLCSSLAQIFSLFRAYLHLSRGNRNGPPIVRRLSKQLSKKLTPWHTVVLTMLWLYLSRNFAKIFGLESPEPLANLYSRSFFRATWITTALDAGFWTAVCFNYYTSSR